MAAPPPRLTADQWVQLAAARADSSTVTLGMTRLDEAQLQLEVVDVNTRSTLTLRGLIAGDLPSVLVMLRHFA
jgi:hypothetical protein